jgi:hypothetical protein
MIDHCVGMFQINSRVHMLGKQVNLVQLVEASKSCKGKCKFVEEVMQG